MPNDSSPSKILLVAWEAADWQMIHALIDAGHLPTLSGLVDRGTIADPAPAEVPYAFVTGMPGNHAPPSPDARPVWQDFAEAGKRCVVVRWPGTHPAGMLPNGGIMVSDQFRLESLPRTPAVEGSVEPTRLRETLENIRLHPSELGVEDIKAFVPELESLTQEQAQPVQWLAGALADTATTHHIALQLLTTEPWDFAAVSYTALSAICQQFLQFSRSDIAPTSPFRQVAATTWLLADQLLAKLLETAGEGTTVLVCSSVGILGKPMAVLAGPGVKEDERLDTSSGEANALDIAPTLRWLGGLPVNDKQPGKPWKQAWQGEPAR